MVATATAPATFYAVVGGNDIYWRVLAPAKALGAKVCVVSADAYQDTFLTPRDDGVFPWRIRDDDLFEYPQHEGAAVWTRPCTMRAHHSLAMEATGIRTLAEVDDNYLSASHLNIFMRMNNYGDEQKLLHLKAMAVHQGLVFATEILRDMYEKAIRKTFGKRHMPELHVARNHVDLDDWPEQIPFDGPLRVGWMGSPQHARDVKLAFRAFQWAKFSGHDVVFMGHDVRDEEGVTNPRALDACRAWRSVITKHIPWTKPEDYHRSVIPFDVGVVPLEYNHHTMGKSDIKVIEMAMSGAAVVVQSHPIYKDWKHNETCLKASSPAEFEVMVRELCNSSSLRERLVSEAQQKIREERSLQKVGVHEWMAAING